MENEHLKHYGVLGMKWGVRRYQNEDGRYTAAGRKRFVQDKTRKMQKDIDSFKEVKGGVKAKNGKVLLSEEEVKEIINALKDVKKKQEQKYGRKYDITKTRQEKTENFVKKKADKKVSELNPSDVKIEQIAKNKVSITADGQTWTSTGSAEKYRENLTTRFEKAKKK